MGQNGARPGDSVSAQNIVQPVAMFKPSYTRRNRKKVEKIAGPNYESSALPLSYHGFLLI